MTEAEFQKLLEDISLCFVRKDIEFLSAHTLLPFALVTPDGPITITTHEELMFHFDLYVKSYEILRVDAIFRRVISLEDCRDGSFIGTYETELLSHGTRVAEPYVSSVLVHDTPEGWKASSILNARGYQNTSEHSPDTKGTI